MISKFIQADSSNVIRKILDYFIHDFVNLTTGATAPHQDIQRGPSSTLAIWMGVKPMCSQLNGGSLTTLGQARRQARRNKLKAKSSYTEYHLNEIVQSIQIIES
jgi:hypothetical protein